MHFSQAYPTTRKAHSGNAFQLAPPAFAILFTQASAVTNTCANSYSFNTGDFADNLKVHRRRSCQGFMRDLSNTTELIGVDQWSSSSCSYSTGECHSPAK